MVARGCCLFSPFTILCKEWTSSAADLSGSAPSDLPMVRAWERGVKVKYLARRDVTWWLGPWWCGGETCGHATALVNCAVDTANLFICFVYGLLNDTASSTSHVPWSGRIIIKSVRRFVEGSDRGIF
jgi:hypothetical protein